MNWKQFLYKVGKGAATGAAVAAGVMFKTGMPITQHGWVLAAGSVASAAAHGALNAIEQYLGAA